MNSIILELYELSDAMSFLEECMDGLSTRKDRHAAGNAYIFGLFSRRISELAALLEHSPESGPGLRNTSLHAPASQSPSRDT